MSRFNDETKMWFEKGEDEQSLSEMPAADQPRRARRPPYLLLGVAAISLASACALYVALKLNRPHASLPSSPVAIQVDHTTPATPAPLEPKATEPTPLEQSTPALAVPPSDPGTTVPARGRKPPRMTAALTLADAFLKRGQIRQALAAYQKIIAHDPTNTLALRGACLSLNRLGRVNDAARVCRRALGFTPDDRDTRAVLARIYHSGGAYDWAANEWRLLLTANPTDPEALRGLRLAKAKL